MPLENGVDIIPYRIPLEWDPKWFENFIREVLAKADTRNMDVSGISLEGDSDNVATLTGAGSSGAFVMISSSAELTDERILAIEASVLTLTDNGAGNTIVIGIAANGIDLTAKVTNELPIANGGTNAATAAAARTNLVVDIAGTDNSTNVTLAGSFDYLTIAGQIITLNAIDLTADVTGDLPVADGGTGASTAAAARTNLGLGTIATQAANNVTITGGAVDDTAIGASTADTLKGTTVEATTFFQVPSYTTAGRPTPAGIANIFDSDLGIPIWHDGTNWIDATGATV